MKNYDRSSLTCGESPALPESDCWGIISKHCSRSHVVSFYQFHPSWWKTLNLNIAPNLFKEIKDSIFLVSLTHQHNPTKLGTF